MSTTDELRDENAQLRDENARLLAEVAPLRAYRQAVFAHWAAEMRDRRDYERNRTSMSEDAFEAWTDEWRNKFYASDPRDSTKWKMDGAQHALTARDHWPEDYAQLVIEMEEEFGE